MKKFLVAILVIVLVVGICPTNTFCITASAERTVVNVYDAETFTTALITANADVVLWNDITYSHNTGILCHSVDLNGYKLTYNNIMTISTSVPEFIIQDSLYDNSVENTGKLVVKNGIKISQGDFVVQSGKIDIYNGVSGSGNFKMLDGEIFVYGSSGSNGSPGRDGEDAVYQNYNGNPGEDGKNGSYGQSGSCGINISSLIVQKGYLYVSGGNGGQGGRGGNGGDGADGKNCTAYLESWGTYNGGTGGAGGDGGNGGNGGDGGHGIKADIVEMSGGIVETHGGTGGAGGRYGAGGSGGKGGSRYSYKGSSGANGANGQKGTSGDNGRSGSGIFAKTVIINNGDLKSYGGNANFSGGAGICSDLTVMAGSVHAYGFHNSSGIGGAGNAYQQDGFNIKINGGYVFAQGSGNGFDIGGGYYEGVGAPGTLEVTGGTLEFTTYGRATNVSSPVFRNCTVTGEGAYQHEGTYNADGKFMVTVEDINIDPTSCVGYDTVAVTASVRVSRSTNITTPKLKGHISFKIDGREFATASIKDANSTDGTITATATTTWVAAEGEHRLSAGYVAGDGDMYAFGGTYAESKDIPLHTHKWNSEYTVDVLPTCKIPGSKSIHCSLCDVQKDFVTVDATGHDYVNNQCQNCQEFLPLIIFKDYDGTILSSEYYYLGDCIVEPDTPSREADTAYTYTFVGWDKNVAVCAGDAVYTAVYESTPIEYNVIFKNYDGTVLSSKTYHYGDVIVVPDNIPQKPADLQYEYVFAGWDSTVSTCDGDKVYTAVFTSDFAEYTVTFKNYDGSIISTKVYRYGDTVEIPNEPSKASDSTYTYSFAGWDKKVTTVTGDAIYTATYDSNYINYIVTFLNSDGTILSQRNYYYDDKVTAPVNPTKAPDKTYTYAFVGWDKNIANCAGDTTYTAVYTPNYIDYTVVFKNWNNTVLSSKIYHYGDEITLPTNPTKAADNTYTYTFAGWDKTVVNCTGDTTYTAVYTPNYIDYTVVFKNYNGAVLSSKTYHYGDAIVAPSSPTKPADSIYTYTFLSWDKNVVNCVGNATYTATFASKYIDYTIVFKNYDGSILSKTTYHYGDPVIEPAAPNKSPDNTYTYSFAGWDDNIAVCSGSKVYTATYTEKFIDYIVTFKNYDGTVLLSKSYHYGDAIITPSTPVKPEDNQYTYTFAGWDSSVVACNGDKTYTATFDSIRKYVIGDFNGDEVVTDADALYLLYHTIFGDSYPIEQDCDYNNDGSVTDADALYLLYHTIFGDTYPLN